MKRDGWSSLRSTGIYALTAGLWILFSDYVASLLFRSEASLTIASTVKGWLFVAVTASILFGILERDRRVGDRLAGEIREAQAQASSILESAPQAIMFIDADGIVTYANHEVEATFGEPASELMGSHGVDIGWVYRDLQGNDIPREQLPGVTVARTGESVHGYVMRITTSDGASRIVSMNAVPKMDEEGRQGALATYTDITATVDAQRRLEHVNRLYAALGEASQAIIGLADGHDPLPEVCRIAVETGGFVMAWVGLLDDQTQLVGPVASFGDTDAYLEGPTISSTDQESGQGPTGTAIRETRTVVCNDIPGDPLMTPWRERAVSRGYLASIAVPLLRDGVAIGAFTSYAPEPGFFGPREIGLLEQFAGDISFAMVFQERERERRVAETGLRRWAEIFENTQVGVVISEFGSPAISLCNPAFSTMHGYSTPGENIGTPLAAMTAPGEHGRHAERRSDAIGKGHSHYEARHVRKDGSTFPVDIDLTIVYDDAGAPRYCIATVVDITDRKATEEELEQHREHLEDLVEERTGELERANADLVRATEAKSQFLANMSHELRTPLNSIIGFTGIMLQGMAGTLNEEQAKQLGMVHRSGRYLLSLINDVLDLSRIEAGRIRVEIESFDMRDALSGVEQTLAPLAREKELGLAFEVPEGAVPVLSDRGKIQQILLNLGGNAIKFTQAGGVTFHTEARPDEVVVTVSDTGVGISPEEQAHIFDEFHQIARAAGDKTQGSGLGLTICRRLARVLGGDVTVSSAPGRGSTFTMSMPTTVPGGSGIARDGRIDLRGRVAMVVEDDPSSLALTTLYLEREGVDVVQVEDGAEALAVARERLPDVILLDISLPAMDGQQVLSRLKEAPETAGIPVICVSAFGPEEYDSRGSAAQLVKPVSRTTLVGQVERVLESAVGHNGNRAGSPDEGAAS